MNTPTTLIGVNLNTVVPDKHSFPVKYWHLGPPEREITWLLDENRIDDAVVYFIHAFGASFVGEMRFLPDDPDTDTRIARLWAEGCQGRSKTRPRGRKPPGTA